MNEKLCKILNDNILDEEKGAAEYHELTNRFARLDDVDSAVEIDTIAKDEERHKSELLKIKRKYCGG